MSTASTGTMAVPRWGAPRDLSLRAPLLAGILLAAMLALAAPPARAEEIHVGVAANFTAPLKALAARFERESGHRVLAISGSSGLLYAQIKHGAPFDLFLSADEERPALLEKEGLAAPGSRFTYAVGQLVLWSATPGLVDPEGAVLRGGRFAKLALANPKTAPNGAAAMQVLEALGVAGQVKDRLVQAQDIGQTFQFVASGNAELGFVALSQIVSGEKERGTAYWLVPQALYSPLRQQAVLLARSAGKPGARAFLNWLRGEDARALIRGSGYGLE